METNTILQGSALEQLKTLPNESIDMCITSPPYWGLRDYGTAEWEGGLAGCNHIKKADQSTSKLSSTKTQKEAHSFYKNRCGICGATRIDKQLGLEPDFRDFIKNLADIFDEVKRVLKPEGTCWVNLGDTYMNNNSSVAERGRSGFGKDKIGMTYRDDPSVQQKSLVQIPNRFAIEMTDRGWILRNEIIWHKPNIMPQSVKDRFTVDFEKLFFFTKSKNYSFNQQFDNAVWDIDGTGTIKRALRQREGLKSNPDEHRNGVRRIYPDGKHGEGHQSAKYVDGKKNKRAVWKINTRPYSEAHFAVYPPELIETPIKAGSPECGVILDPFFGSGTTGEVALKLDRKFIGVELNPEYIKIANKRLKPILDQQKLPL